MGLKFELTNQDSVGRETFPFLMSNVKYMLCFLSIESTEYYLCLLLFLPLDKEETMDLMQREIKQETNA